MARELELQRKIEATARQLRQLEHKMQLVRILEEMKQATLVINVLNDRGQIIRTLSEEMFSDPAFLQELRELAQRWTNAFLEDEVS